MILIRGNNPQDSCFEQFISSGTAVTIGNFDGIHQGHQHIFDDLSQTAEQHNLKKVLITFEPRPVEFFSKDKKNERLTLLRDKIKLLKNNNFDCVWVMNFNSTMAATTAEDFIANIYNKLNIKYLFVGQDFRFGQKRAGDINLLQKFAQGNGFVIRPADDYILDNTRVSSSQIRDLLLNNSIDNDFYDNLAKVKKCLGRYYSFTGKVVKGQQKGRELGYPTVNIHVKPRQLVLSKGVYAVNIIHNNTKYPAMANWGIRPTVAEKLELVLEAHIFNFNQEIYNQNVTVEFIAKIRDEKKFAAIDELVAQLDKDMGVVTEFFNNYID